MLTALLLLTALDVTVTLSPEPLAVSEAVYGRLRGVGTWSARICSESDDRLTVSAVRIYAAAAGANLRPIGRSRVLILLDKARYERSASRVARAIEWGLIGATAFGAGQQISPRALQYLALSIPIAKRAVDLAKERVTVFDAAELLDGELTLEPGACVERVMFSGLVKSAHPVIFTVRGRGRTFVSSVTSIPGSGL